MMLYKDKSVLIVDSGGLFVSAAERLAQDFGKVYYFLPNYEGRPSLNKSMVGERLKNVKVIEQMFYKWNDYKSIAGDYDFNSIDLFLFPDIYFGDLQLHLIHDCNKVVWGSRKGEELELLRYETKKKLAGIGLAVTPTEMFTDYNKLYDYLSKAKGEKYIKLSWFRGVMESSKFEGLPESLSILASLKSTLKECYADEGENSMEIIAEDPIESEIEVGIDTWCIDGEIPKNIGVGMEIKNKLYCCRNFTYDELPEQLKDTTYGIQKLIKEYGENGYRGFMSTEVRIDNNGEGHLIDFTARYGSPPSELQQEWLENYSEIIFEGANGKVVEPKYKSKYAAQIAIYSPNANESQDIEIPDKIKQFVKINNYCGIEKEGNGKYGIIPIEKIKEPVVEIGFVIGLGETPDECFEKIKGYSEQIKGENLIFKFDAIDEVTKEIKKLEKTGVKF